MAVGTHRMHPCHRSGAAPVWTDVYCGRGRIRCAPTRRREVRAMERFVKIATSTVIRPPVAVGTPIIELAIVCAKHVCTLREVW